MVTAPPNPISPRCSGNACEIVIFRLQQAAERNPQDWVVRYRLGLCYSGRCQQHALVSPDLAVGYLRSACKAMHQVEVPETRAAVLALLALMYVSASRLPLRARLLAAVECYEEAAKIYFECGAVQEWARMQHNLGNTWCDMPEHDSPAKWETAIVHYKNALLFRSRQAQPGSFAATLMNLGTAYRRRGEGHKTENLGQAIQCYRRSLRLSPAAIAPARWAALHNNLGNACLSLPYSDVSAAASHARHAIYHFDLALRVRTRERDLFDYAVTRLNRGQACLQLGLAGFPARLHEALQSFRDAHASFLQTAAENAAALAQKTLQLATQALSYVNEFGLGMKDAAEGNP